ncbi:unnamed protein product [Caenorhabditis brenneri]
MRTLIFLFTSSLFVSSVLNCLVASDCPCGDIFYYAHNPEVMLYTKQSGCVQNISCLIDYSTNVFSQMNESEIPKPANSLEEIETFAFQTTVSWSDPPGPIIDIFSYFGMVCENNTWFVTKYPAGIAYFDSNGEFTTIEPSNKYNGRKSKIAYFAWLVNTSQWRHLRRLTSFSLLNGLHFSYSNLCSIFIFGIL